MEKEGKGPTTLFLDLSKRQGKSSEVTSASV